MLTLQLLQSLFPFAKLPDLGELLNTFGELENAFETSGLIEFSSSDFNYVKFHDLTHHLLAILLFEDPGTYSTQVGERLNGREIRQPYQRGNKRDNEEFVNFPSLNHFLAMQLKL